ncbi:hypothetical protein NDU88_011129, partial [Pleurodeles waltl]
PVHRRQHHRLQCHHKASLPAPWHVDTACEGHDASSRPAPLAWNYRRHRFRNNAATACTMTCGHCMLH